jgi:acyl transferase domain-containing protein/NADPH:quinone reductase-like Zn-dependent oxidoreductase/NADP-dependent 3-hydroxy acid dehydrogenase YdfG/SAM-dependent methyltransferase/acyl carrier protein
MRVEATSHDKYAIAIVGLACRLPGGISTLEDLWSVLMEGRDLVTEVPPDRFDQSRFVDTQRRRPGKSCTGAGGFLDDIAGFDAEFFGISPREAAQIDPQQRLILEMTVEALDDAGIAPGTLAGSDTGVFIGVSSRDYAELQQIVPTSVNLHTMAGNAAANIANRISYLMDWRGESMAVDTACSSALTAVHRAYEHLQISGAPMVLTGGINLILSPFGYVGFSAATMLSPTGRCQTFSAQADGFVRAEGGGVVLLKRLSDALADGDRVHAVILATGANSDGRTAGLTLPSGDAQESLLRNVYARAAVTPDQLSYLETHGTGTAVGDPIECGAIGRALGRHRTTGALPVGSIKSNVGHLEAASGIAGLLKSVLVLRHRRIPPTLHAQPLNPEIDFVGWQLQPSLQPQLLPETERLVVGVNSFGFGGANAHVVLATPPVEQATNSPTDRAATVPLIVSGRGEAALATAAQRIADRLQDVSVEGFYDLAYTTCRRRAHHEQRIAVLADDPAQAAKALLAASHGEPLSPQAASARVVRTGKVAFAFSGNGSQWAGMGADLLQREPMFAAAVERVDAALAPYLGWSVRKKILSVPELIPLAATEVAQPLLFAMQVGLVELLKESGICPSAVVGHSVGEIAAAYVCGALSFDDAALVVATRSQAQAATAGSGRMAAVGLSEQRARALLAGYDGRLEVAGINSSADVTLSGDEPDLLQCVQALTAEGVFTRVLDLNYAFHSRAMDPIERPIRTVLAQLRASAATVPFYSSVTGTLLAGQELTADYWWRNVRQPVRFAEATQAMLDDGADVIVEIGPHPILTPYLRHLAGTCEAPIALVPTGTRHSDGPDGIRHATVALLACGADLDWHAWFPQPGRVVDLPPYPWQRERHWNGAPQWWERTHGQDGAGAHPLLGARLLSAEPTWSGALEPARVPWLVDHKVGETVLMPAAAYVEMGFAAVRQTTDGPVEVDCLHITRALIVPWDDDAMELRLQVSLSDESHILRVASRVGAGPDWRQHARGRARRLIGHSPAPVDLDRLRRRMREEVPITEHYARMARIGLSYGPTFQVLTDIHVGAGEVLAAYAVNQLTDDYQVHPTLLDGALQAGASLLRGSDALFLPAAIEAARLWRPPAATGWVHVRTREVSAWEVCWDISVTDEDGQVALEVQGCRLRRFTGAIAAPVERYDTVLRAAPHPHSPTIDSVLAPPSALLAATTAQPLPPKVVRIAQRDMDFIHRCKQLTAFFTVEAIKQLLPGRNEFEFDDLRDAGILTKYTRLVEVLLAAACNQGVLRDVDQPGPRRWRMTTTPPPEELFQTMMHDFPDYTFALVLPGRCGLHLADVLRGMCDPLELILADADRHIIEWFYTTLVGGKLSLYAARTLLMAAVADWPADRPLRILEVGAGTGGFTSGLLDVLPPERTQYVFTDISSAFFSRARFRFEHHGFLEYCTFNLECDPAEQGLADESFDFVIAANVLHATTDLRATLGRVQRLLAPGGQLVALESHDTEHLAPIFGLLDGFWIFTDLDLRTTTPLLSAARWLNLLPGCGFTDAHIAGDGAHLAHSTSSLVVAQRPITTIAAPAQRPPCAPPEHPPIRWLIAVEGSEGPMARALAAELNLQGHQAHVQQLGLEPAERFAAVSTETIPSQVVVLLDDEPVTAPAAATDQAVARIAALGAVAAACNRTPGGTPSALWLITRPSGALPAPEVPTHPCDAAVWGAARCLAHENAQLTVRRVSLERGIDPAADAARLVLELLAPTGDDEVVLTRSGRFIPRVVRRRPNPDSADGHADGPYHLEVRTPGLSPELVWTLGTPRDLGPDDVLIEVRAAGLNYRDILVTTGMITPQPGTSSATGHRLGIECAGIVAAVGSQVRDFAPGDRVCALALGGLASHAVSNAATVAHLPPEMTFTEGATLPVVFFTNGYSLNYCARLAPGETVLIHGATGGIGLSALQLAKACGANVIATAGTEAKRDLLRLLGVRHVLDSRSLDFTEDVRRLTDGQGVDVVLNSLAGEALVRSLEVLRPGGRFVELGKRDILNNSQLPMRFLDNNIAVFAVDSSRLFQDPTVVRYQLREMATRISAGDYWPLPHQVYPACQVHDAIAALQHSRHIGKVIIDFEQPPVVHRPRPPATLDPEATYLITGGLTGLGAVTARQLAARGARHLALLGRRGTNTPEAEGLLAELDQLGVRAHGYAVDVTDTAALREVLDVIQASGHPPRGIVHCAMVLDDDPLTELTTERIRTALAPKMQGGLVLDSLTADQELDFMVFYSSITTVIGMFRQGNYAAGNLFLEALTRARRHTGRPVMTIGWGMISDIGYVARNQLNDTLAHLGAHPVTPDEVRSEFDELLTEQTAISAVGRFDWHRIAQLLPGLAVPRFAAVMSTEDRQAGSGARDLRQQLDTASDDDALALVGEAVAEAVAGVLQTTPERLDRTHRLDQLGLDSLMAAELVVAIRNRLGCEIPPLEIASATGINDLTRRILPRLRHTSGGGPETPRS